MPKKPSIAKVELQGAYVWRGGRKIELEKEPDRFTIIPSSADHLDRLRSAPGVRNIKEITNQVFKVETTPTDRDSAMAALRSDAFNAVVHHAYRPKGSDGTVYYLTDKIIVTFTDKATPTQIECLLNKFGLRVLKEYEGDKNSLLVQVTASSSANPVVESNP